MAVPIVQSSFGRGREEELRIIGAPLFIFAEENLECFKFSHNE
jgi:hypothetical protein